MLEKGSEEGLLVRAEYLELTEEISHRMVDVARVVDGAPSRRRTCVGWGDQHKLQMPDRREALQHTVPVLLPVHFLLHPGDDRVGDRMP